jgi:hypothetical protein
LIWSSGSILAQLLADFGCCLIALSIAAEDRQQAGSHHGTGARKRTEDWLEWMPSKDFLQADVVLGNRLVQLQHLGRQGLGMSAAGFYEGLIGRERNGACDQR